MRYTMLEVVTLTIVLTLALAFGLALSALLERQFRKVETAVRMRLYLRSNPEERVYQDEMLRASETVKAQARDRRIKDFLSNVGTAPEMLAERWADVLEAVRTDDHPLGRSLSLEYMATANPSAPELPLELARLPYEAAIRYFELEREKESQEMTPDARAILDLFETVARDAPES